MIGDPEWLDLLDASYQEHVAASARADRPCQPFDGWAADRTWDDFCRLARLAKRLPAYTINDWRTENPVPAVYGSGHGSRVLARRLIDALVLTTAVMRVLYQESRKAHRAAQAHLERGRVGPGQEIALRRAKDFVYHHLRRIAEAERVSAAAG